MSDDYTVDTSKAQDNIENMVIRAAARLMADNEDDVKSLDRTLDVFDKYGVSVKIALQILSELYDVQEDEDEI